MRIYIYMNAHANKPHLGHICSVSKILLCLVTAIYNKNDIHSEKIAENILQFKIISLPLQA